jgi:hypothetical protein
LLAAAAFPGHGPKIFVVVENLRHRHVVAAVLRDLRLEEVLRIAHVAPQSFGHPIKRGEQGGQCVAIDA